MLQRRIPDWVRHAPAPGLRGFAVLSAFDAASRGILLSVFPLLIYRAVEDAKAVSHVYFAVGLCSLAAGLLIPWLTRFLPRRWTFSAGALLYVASATVGALGGPALAPLALLFYTFAAVTVFVCLNAYVLDYVAQAELGRCETLRMFYSALGWTAGPALGVWLMGLWAPAPFLVSGAAGLCQLAAFWRLRLGNGKLIRRAGRPAPNPLQYLARFVAQPRLVAGWLFAILRSCGWWVYVVYLPIFALEAGLGEKTGGIALSITNGLLFATPLMLRWMQRRTVRAAVRTGFLWSGLLFCLAAPAAAWPWAAVGCLFVGSAFLILLDICGGLPFLMAVKPSERTEMSAVYSSFRDVSGIVTPGLASVLLLAAPVAAVFGLGGAGLLVAWAIAGTLPERLGRRRVRRAAPAVAEPAAPA